MKKKFKHTLLFFAILLFVNSFTIESVNAEQECKIKYNAATGEFELKCVETGDNAHGDRVYATGSCDGLRCWRTVSKTGVRITLVDKNGNRVSGTATKDYWFNMPTNTGTDDEKACITISGSSLRTKQELANSDYNSYIGTSCDNYMPKANKYNFSISHSMSTDGTPNIAGLVYDFNNAGTLEPLNELLSAVGYSKRIDELSISELTNLYFQFEPLYQFEFYGDQLKSNRGIQNITMIGTFSEILAMTYVEYHGYGEYIKNNGQTIITEHVVGPSQACLNILEARAKYPGIPQEAIDGACKQVSTKITLTTKYYNYNVITNGSKYSLWRSLNYKYKKFDVYASSTSSTPANVFGVGPYTLGANIFTPGRSDNNNGYALGYIWLLQAVEGGVGCEESSLTIWNNKNSLGLTEYNAQLTALKNKLAVYGMSLTWDPNGNSEPVCGEPPVEPCQPTMSFDNCVSGILQLEDNGNPSCWYDSNTAYNYGGSTQVSKEAEMGSGYCDVYCFETFTTDFPTSVDSVKAGQTFLWGNGSRGDGLFGSISATRTCRTKTYKYNEWKTTWTANENNLRNAYNNYVQAQRMTVGTNKNCNYSVTTQVTVYECNRYQPVNGGAAAGGYDKLIDSKTFGYSYDGNGNLVYPSNPPSDYIPANGWACSPKDVRVATENRGNDGYTYTATGGVSSDNRSNYGCTLTQDQANKDGNNYRGSVISRYWNQYTGFLTNRTTISNNIKACYTGNVPYNNTTKVTINFSDPLGFRNISTTLNSSGNSSTSQNTNLCTVKQELTYNCAGSGCTVGYTPFVDCSGEGQYAEWNMSASYNYYYTSEFMWNSVKDTNDIVRASGSSGLYYSIGYGLPTSLSLPNGYYGLSATVTGFGHNGHFNNITNTYDYNSCTYKVVNELFGTDCKYDSNGTLTSNSPFYCDPQEDSVVRGTVKGIDLVYRIVSFDNMFPSIDGDGRVPGSNWATVIGTSMYNSITTNDIVYDSEPMYQIELTPALISEIRADNEKYRENGKDPYTSYEASTGSNKEIKCVTNHTIDGTYCVSEFLTELMTENILTGTCTNSGLSSEERANLILANGC